MRGKKKRNNGGGRLSCSPSAIAWGMNTSISYLLALRGSRTDVDEKHILQHNKMNLETQELPFPENTFSGIFILCIRLFM